MQYRESIECEKCGGNMIIDTEQGIYKCPYCESIQVIPEDTVMKIARIGGNTAKRAYQKHKEYKKNTQEKQEKQYRSNVILCILVLLILSIIGICCSILGI